MMDYGVELHARMEEAGVFRADRERESKARRAKMTDDEINGVIMEIDECLEDIAIEAREGAVCSPDMARLAADEIGRKNHRVRKLLCRI